MCKCVPKVTENPLQDQFSSLPCFPPFSLYPALNQCCLSMQATSCCPTPPQRRGWSPERVRRDVGRQEVKEEGLAGWREEGRERVWRDALGRRSRLDVPGSFVSPPLLFHNHHHHCCFLMVSGGYTDIHTCSSNCSGGPCPADPCQRIFMGFNCERIGFEFNRSVGVSPLGSETPTSTRHAHINTAIGRGNT